MNGPAGIALVALLCGAASAGRARSFAPGDGYWNLVNTDESKVHAYELEDPLTFLDGSRVRTAADWARRRKELVDLFAREMYGAIPPRPDALVIDLLREKADCAGFAVRKDFRMSFREDRSGPAINWTLWIPRHARARPGVIVFLNYEGNHEYSNDPAVPVPVGWVRNRKTGNRPSPETRGKYLSPDGRTHFPIATILARNWAVLTASYCEVSPDPAWDETDPRWRPEPFAYTGVFELWGARDEAREDNVTALGAWAWALSRGLDLAEREPAIDAKRNVVTGSSRLGKAALLAASRDERFAVCVPNQTGGGGVPLAKRDFGENTLTENEMFPHWFCKAYRKYATEPWRTLTFDQHLLLATVAPRRLLVQGFDSAWFDPYGEYLAVRAAAPVWTFLGKRGLPDAGYPEPFDTSCIGGDLGYVRRTERHGLSAQDWQWLMDFAK